VFEWLSLTPEVHREAERLILARPEIPVRASDALHIAQALTSGAGVLITFDNRLARAAEAAGLVAFPHTT
jgi:predicted nucleic acid-binding protein